MENRLEKRRPFYTGQLDFPLLFAIALLCAFGLVMLFSASYYYAQNTAATKYDGFFYLKSQAMYLAVGLVAMYVVSRVDYHFFDKIRVFALVGTLALMLLVLIPGLGVDRNGAQRWLKIPGTSFTFQPSELAKFALIVYMAGFMSRRPQAMKNLTKGVFPMLFIMGAFGLVLLLQKNMSMMVIMMMTGVVMLFLGGAEIKHLLLLARHCGADSCGCGADGRIPYFPCANVHGSMGIHRERCVSASPGAHCARRRRRIRTGLEFQPPETFVSSVW